MRKLLMLAATVALAFGAVGASADDRADWGVAVSVGWEDGVLLLENDRGMHLIVVDADATIASAAGKAMTISDIRPGDHVDYAVTTWAQMPIAYALAVTPRRQAAQRP